MYVCLTTDVCNAKLYNGTNYETCLYMPLVARECDDDARIQLLLSLSLRWQQWSALR
jgi:hypothetical protein